MGSWDTKETSGFLDGVRIWIDRAFFGTDAEYDEGNTTILILEGVREGPDVDPENADFRQFLSTGSKWEHRDGGKTAVHADGSEEFHAMCAYARFFTAFMELGDDADKVLRGRGFPDEAEIWVGLGMYVEQVEVDFGNIGKKSVLLPTQYLGDDRKAASGGSGGPSSPSPKAKAAAAKAKAKAAAAGGDSDGMQAELVAFAKGFESHDEFLTAAYDKWPEIEDFAEFADLIDENGTVWTEAQAG